MTKKRILALVLAFLLFLEGGIFSMTSAYAMEEMRDEMRKDWEMSLDGAEECKRENGSEGEEGEDAGEDEREEEDGREAQAKEDDENGKEEEGNEEENGEETEKSDTEESREETGAGAGSGSEAETEGSEESEGGEETDEGEEKEPEVTFPAFWVESVVNDAGNTVTDPDGIYYFRDSVKIMVRIEETGEGEGARDDIIGGEQEPGKEGVADGEHGVDKGNSVDEEDEEDSKGIVDGEDEDDRGSADEGDDHENEGVLPGQFVIRRDGIELTGEDGDFEDVMKEDGEYVYTIVYITADHEISGEHSLTVRGRKILDVPSIEGSYTLPPVEACKKQYVTEDPEIRIRADAPAGILLAEYREGDGAYKVWKDFQREDTCYAYGEQILLEENLKESDEFTERMTDMEDGSYAYAFRITDVLGGSAETELEFIVDKTEPDSQVFVSYTSEGAGPEAASYTGIMDFMRSVADRLFGKTEIWFDLYITDGKNNGQKQAEVSGIDTEDLHEQILTADGKAEIRKLQTIDEGEASFLYEGKQYNGYAHIRGCIALPSGGDQNIMDRLRIKRLKDRAGNMTDTADTEDMTGATVLYLDAKSPVLSVDYKEGMIDDVNKTVFYPGRAVLELAVKEKNYLNYRKENGDPVTPSVSFTDSGGCGASVSGWRVSGQEEDQVYAELIFPEMAETGEAVYDFTVGYQDGSGNPLEIAKAVPGEICHGIYTGYTVVVDNRPPELTFFSMDGDTTGQCGGIDVYQNVEGADIRFSFGIDDHEQYWDPEAVKLTIWNTGTDKEAIAISGSSLQWKEDGRSHQTVYAFDGEEGTTVSAYRVLISYEDRAGNRLTGRGELNDTVREGIYMSREFLLDHKAPVFCITYDQPVRLVRDDDTDPSQDRRGCRPQTGYTAYYSQNVEVSFSVLEQCAYPVCQGAEITGLRDFEVIVTGKDTGSFQPIVRWSKAADLYEGRFFLTEEDQYTVSVRYQDAAGNGMAAEEVYGSRWEAGVLEDGTYESIPLVLDRTAPVFQVSYVDMAQQEIQEGAVRDDQGCRYFSEPVCLKLEVRDENIRFYELLHELRRIHVSDREGNELSDNSAGMFLARINEAQIMKGAWTWYIPLLTEAVYEIPVACTDLSGNSSERTMERVCVDRTAPDLELSYSVEKSGFLDAVRYGDIRYLFADGRMTIRASARDQVSGIRSIRYRIEEENGKATERSMAVQPALSVEHEITVPTASADFKGMVTVEAGDWSGNCTVQSCGHIIERDEKHGQEGGVQILTETSPSRSVGGVDYYNTDVRLKLMFQDRYSGLRDITCKGGDTIDRYRAFSEEEGIVYECQEELVLEAASNNENEVLVWAECQDHAGHTSMAEQLYNIDITLPVIEVEYDNNNRSDAGLYQQARTATVTIRERNFDPADVEFLITNTDGILPSTGDWQESGTGDDTLHVCHVNFFADGDYTFTLGFTDLAGNRAEYGRVDEFTIDQTEPVMTVSFENERNSDQEYYAQNRVAVIDVLEHHFDASLIQIMAAERNGGRILNEAEWHRYGDHNVTRIRFDADGDYTLKITGKDQAGNPVKEYGPEHFIIDQTAPVLEISGLEGCSANKGIVMPVIRCSDANYQKGTLNIRLRGCRNGLTKLEGKSVQSADGEQFIAEDIAYVPEMDDLYRLSVSVSDLAGNVSEEEIRFSVNRFGSVYTLEDKTELLAGSRGIYYTNTEQDIIVTETNADTLEFLEISCNRNGKLLTMERGRDYFVDVSGTDESWKQYVYTIPEHNFTEEGTYILTIYSEDRAENVSDNQTKGKKLEFVVDKTAPSVLLSGVEDGGQYREKSREITLDVQDNVRMSEVRVRINGAVSTYHASEVLERDGRITLSVGSADHWQTVSVTAFDAAGNWKELEKLRFLLTPNLLIQFLMDQSLFYRTMGGMVLAWAGGWWIFFRRKRFRKCKRSRE